MEVPPSLLRKTRELSALATLSIETFTKAEKGLQKAFTKKELDEIIQTNKQHLESINLLFDDEQITKVKEKAEKTKNKLGGMQKIYLEEKWDEPLEVLEWLGFIEGAAVVHWSLVEELATESKMDSVENFALLGYRFHKDLLIKISKAIKEIN